MTDRRRRPPIATGARVAAAGLGGTAMFGIMASLAAADQASPATTSTPQTPRVIVVIHDDTQPLGTAAAAATTTTDTTASAPIALQAQPVITTVELQPAPSSATAPVAQTNGSR